MIMAKSCHDLDMFAWLLGKKCKRVSSYGDLYLFKPENAPKGAAKRCMDGCKVKEQCPYDAEKIYITNPETGIRGLQADPERDKWPVCILSPNNLSEEAIYQAIQEGPYGRCVYACDNDVVDHQVVNMEFEDHVTVSFTMTAFTSKGGRTIKICGTLGDIIGDLSTNKITVTPYGKESQMICATEGDMSGHAGGDNRLIHDFVSAVQEEMSESSLRTGIDASIESHVIAIAAEYSRCHDGESVDLEEFVQNCE